MTQDKPSSSSKSEQVVTNVPPVSDNPVQTPPANDTTHQPVNPGPVTPAVDHERAVHEDELLASAGQGFLVTEPEVAAAAFNQPESLVRAAFVMRGRMRLSEDEMRAALDEVSNREV
jgi:hypothetical protein